MPTFKNEEEEIKYYRKQLAVASKDTRVAIRKAENIIEYMWDLVKRKTDFFESDDVNDYKDALELVEDLNHVMNLMHQEAKLASDVYYKHKKILDKLKNS